MPSNSPQVKKAAVQGYGGQVIECEPNLAARESTSERVCHETGATFIHPYNNEWVIAGQGTLALELLEQVPDLDAVIAPVGGGGMISGCVSLTLGISIVCRGLNPKIRVFAAEPLGADDAARSMAAGVWQPQTNPVTIADGLKTSLGDKTWPIIQRNVEAVITISEKEIEEAMLFIWERVKLVIEPSAAVGVAAILSERFRSLEGINRVGVVLCGGNVDIKTWKWTV